MATTTRQQIESLTASVLVATDEGTHAMPETIRVYERLDGTRYAVSYFAGASVGTPSGMESVHGRLRWLDVTPAAERRKQVAHLRALELAEAKTLERLANRRAELLRGFDGYQYVGLERGRELAAQLS